MKWVLHLVGTLIALSAGVPVEEILEKQNPVNYRLPKTIFPSNYAIELTPYFVAEPGKSAFTFDGETIITLSTAFANINEIVMHSKNIDLPNNLPTLTDAKDPSSKIRILSKQQDLVTDKLILGLEEALRPNVDYKLTFKYTGHLADDMHGFYKSSYVVNGVTKWIGTTQFQPTHARRAFPCFDEPGFKATFDVKINRLTNFNETVSNTRLLESVPNVGPNRVRDVFATTPKMSTYLLAFIVSEFDIRQNVQKTFGILSRPDATSQTEYAFEIGPKMLAKFDEWTDYPYSSVPEMTKMHMAALPDFSAGAMENWGLLTYRETNLLYDPEASTAQQQQRIVSVIAHEQAHMWFGDLITCDWWSYTWLNEGFARFFQYYMSHKLIPSWDLEWQFILEQTHAAFTADAQDNTHPMSYDVNSPKEVQAIFDNISYNKGAAIIRMIQHIMGDAAFKTALNNYIKENQYGLSTPEKLQKSLQQQVVDLANMAAIIGTWTAQSGFPVVKVERHSNRKSLTISQKRYSLKNKDHNDESLWEIPMNYATPNDNPTFANTMPFFTMTRSQKSISLELSNETDWIIFNVQQTGFYRVNYDDGTWQNIGQALKRANHSNIHVLNRAQIVDDMMNLARADYIDYNLVLSTLQYLEKEENHIPWASAFNNLAYITRRLFAEDLTLLKKYVINLTENLYKKLGFTEKQSDTRLDIYSRVNLLSHICKFGHEECIELAQKEFAHMQTTTKKVPVNLRPTVYCTAVAEGAYDEWIFLWRKFLAENVATEQVVILNALGCTKNETLLEEYMEHIIGDHVRLQDKAAAFNAAISGHEDNLETVYNFVVRRMDAIETAFGSIANVETILANVAARFTTQSQIDNLEKFYNANKDRFESSPKIAEAIVEAKYNLKWAEQHAPQITEYMKQSNSATKFGSFGVLLVIAAVLARLI